MAKEFKIGEQTLKVSDELEHYNALRYEFVVSANEACKTFERCYQSENRDLDDVRNNVEAQIDYSMRETIYKDLRLLLEEGIYDVDKYIFIDDYCQPKGYLPIIDACHDVIAKCNAIDVQVQQKKAERAYNKEMRGRVFGGGFGFEGALSGMAMAGAMNMATGIAYSGFNAIANWVTRRVANSEKRSLFNNPETLATLTSNLYESALNTHFAYIDVVEERTEKQIPKYDPADRRRALAMHNNIAMLLPEEPMEEKIAVAMLMLNPYEKEFYRNLILNYGDQKLEVQAAADFFHVDIGNVKSDLIWNYVNTFSFNKIETIDGMLDAVGNRAEYYGIFEKEKKAVLDETYRRYCEWILDKWWKKDLGIYLKWQEKEKEYVDLCNREAAAVKGEVKELFDQYFGKEDKYFYVGEELPTNIYFTISNNTEKKSQAIALCLDGIYYGEMRKIEYRYVQNITVQNDTVIVNDAIRIPLLQKVNQENLQAFLNEAVATIKKHSMQPICDLLELGEIETEKSLLAGKRVEEILTEKTECSNRIWRNVTLVHMSNLVHINELNNIKVKLNVYRRDNREIAPVFWLKNESAYVVFEAEGISFTANGQFIPYSEIEKPCQILEDTITLSYKNEENILFREECDEWQMLCDFINGVIAEFAHGGNCVLSDSVHDSQGSIIMEPFMRWKNSYLLKRYGEDTRRQFDYFLSIDCNSQSFTSFIDLFSKKNGLPENEVFLAMVRGAYYSYDVLLFSTQAVYILKEKAKEPFIRIPLSECREILVEYVDVKNTMKLFTTSGEMHSVFCITDNDYVANRPVIANDILQKLLEYVKSQDISKPTEYELMTAGDNLSYRYIGYALNHSEAAKNLAFVAWKDSMKDVTKWADKGMGEFLSCSRYEKILFFYNQRKLKASNVKLALTEKYLYVGGQHFFKVPVDRIMEVRQSYEGAKKEFQVATKQGVYTTAFEKENLPVRVSDLLSDVIFMLQQKKQEVLAITDMQEMEEERKKARRVKPGEYEEEHRDFVQKITEYCASKAEEGLFGEEGPTLILNDESEEFKQAYEEAVASSDEKPDPIEVPLFIIQNGHMLSSNKSKFMAKRGKVLFATNEFWYNLGTGFGKKNARLPISDICSVRIDEGKKTKKAKILAETEDGKQGYQMPQGLDEFIEIYCDFYQVLIEELKNVIVDEKISKEELEREKEETKKLCGDIGAMSKEEVIECQNKLLDYSFAGSEEVERQLETRMKELIEDELKSQLSEEISIDNLLNLQKELLTSDEKRRYKRAVQLLVEDRIIEKATQLVQPKVKQLNELIQEAEAETREFGVMNSKFRGAVTETVLKLKKADIEITDIPLVTCMSGKNMRFEGYVLFEKFLLTYYRGHFMKIPYEQIEKIIMIQKMSNVNIAAVVNGKNVVISGLHKRENRKYAILLSRMVTYLKTGELIDENQIQIDLVTMEEQIDSAMSKVNDVVSDTVNEKFGDQVETAKKVTGNIGNVFGKATKKAKEAGSAVAAKGSSLSELGTKECPDCGNKVKITSKFCGKCGHRF